MELLTTFLATKHIDVDVISINVKDSNTFLEMITMAILHAISLIKTDYIVYIIDAKCKSFPGVMLTVSRIS